MSIEDVEERYLTLLQEGDHAEAARLLRQHPELVAEHTWAQVMMGRHARAGNAEFVRVLLDAGVDVNILGWTGSPNRPLFSAVCGGSAEVVRLLLERGSDVNWDSGRGRVYCVPLSVAIESEQLDLIQLLVEAGAALDVCDNLGLTPLSWALATGRQDIIDYLRSKGAVLPEDTPGYVAPPRKTVDPLEGYINWHTCGICKEPLTQDGSVAIRIGNTNNDGNHPVLFTQGMSSRAMQVPADGDPTYQHAELVLFLRLYQFSETPSDWREPKLAWYIDWLLKIARWPFENNTWLNGKWTIISNGDKPKPLSKFTKMTCWLLLGEKEPLSRVELPDGRSVCFYTLMPIHTAERDLALNVGLVALLQLFADNEVPVQLDPRRKSVV